MYDQREDLNVILLVSLILHSGASLECYKCTAVLDLDVCDATQRCHDRQVCFLNSTVSGEIQVTSLGCTSQHHCDGNKNNLESSTVGGEIEPRETSCFECCSTDLCNKRLCQHLKPPICEDDESVDCAKMDLLFSICSETDNAKRVCPRFCGLCYMYPVDGSWSNWSKWSQCDVTCGNGTETRTRLCNNPVPKNGGKECLGNKMSKQTCFMEHCPVDGGWSPWEAWMSCSTSCDIGLQSRKRICSNPVPDRNGQYCFGNNFDVRQCMPMPCANGGWSDWDNSNACSVTCGAGVRLKSRSCSNPPPSPFGLYCIGEHSQIESCTMPKCGSRLCQTDPCERGHCIDMSHDFICVCDVGFQGRYCNISTGFCPSSPCLNGICLEGGKAFSCNCPPGFTGTLCQTIIAVPASDCYDVLKMNIRRRRGVYWIKLWKSGKEMEVFCDLETDNGGWTVFQLRFDGSLEFHRNFSDYRNGFGNVYGEFWLGLQNVYEMASQGQSELRIDLEAADGTKAYENFQKFSLSPGKDYTLHISEGTGTAGTGMQGLSYHNGKTFSTYDYGSASRCASTEKDYGGWWYGNCAHANLNGKYVTPGTINPTYSEGGVTYRKFQGIQSLKQTKMMFRRIS